MRRIEADFRALATPVTQASVATPVSAAPAETLRLPRDTRTLTRGGRTRMTWEGSPAARTAPLIRGDHFQRSPEATRRFEDDLAMRDLLEGLRLKGMGDHPRVRVLEAWQAAGGLGQVIGKSSSDPLARVAKAIDKMTVWMTRLLLAPTDQKGQKQDQLSQVRSHLESGAVDRALAMLRQICRAHPDDLDARALLGELLTDRGEYLEAAGHLDHVAEGRPNRASSWIAVGRLAYQRGQSAKAFEAFGEAWRLSPEASDTNAWLGIMAHDAGRLPEATRFLERAVALDSGNSVARYFLGRTAMAEGDSLRARFQFELVQRLQPTANLTSSLHPEPALTPPRKDGSAWAMPRPRAAGLR
ncbi:MAG: tetratricopeptide repeat protein [Candidatus Sericytochromatia bacterium]|nr:tetratricopeptide repeat protein [Candidatus Sericytochromatia bacterium]